MNPSGHHDKMEKDSGSPVIQRTSSFLEGAVEDVQLTRSFGFWGITSVAWNMLNIFGGMSYICVVGLSAGGISTIFYGFIGSCLCVFCIMAILAECASMFPTAGGAYHFSTFLAPERYRRLVGYPLGWLNFLGWVFTIASCASIGSGLTLSLTNLIDPTFDVTVRWRIFLVYVGWCCLAWAINSFMLTGTAYIESIGCWISMLGFACFCMAIWIRSEKASAAFVFQDIINETGYVSPSMAVVLGLYNSMACLVCLDAPCHLAEEIAHPAIQIPRIIYIVIGTQFIVGVVYILTIGFAITDIQVIINTSTGVPIIEIIRQALRSKNAAIVFNVVLLINFIGSSVGAALASSRQSYALARDGGLPYASLLTKVHPRLHTPFHSVTLCFVLTVLIGIVLLFSTQGFNAVLGAEVLFMILSYAAPSMMMLLFGRGGLKETRFSLGRLGYFCATVSVLYAGGVAVLVMVPQVHPVTASTMNYTIVLAGIFAGLCPIMWLLGAKNSYRPPSFEDFVDHAIPMEDRDAFLEGHRDH